MIGLRGKTHKLEVLRNPSCTACPLHHSTTNVCVMGRGNTMAKVMLIGEAPGKAESRTGKPFMGAAGKLLDETLELVGLTGKVYISNICRCRPFDNRTPTLAERITCSRLYLMPEIRIIEPVIIVALGRVATYTLFGADARRGQRHRLYLAGKHREVIATWHPAAYLHSGSKAIKKQLREHLNLVSEMLNATTARVTTHDHRGDVG